MIVKDWLLNSVSNLGKESHVFNYLGENRRSMKYDFEILPNSHRDFTRKWPKLKFDETSLPFQSINYSSNVYFRLSK